MEDLIFLIKEKKELQGISNDYVKKRLTEFLEENPKVKKKYDNSNSLKEFVRSKEHKILLKEVRAKLREVYGAFILDTYSKMRKNIKQTRKILSMHRSSKERLPYYDEVYRKIFNITGKPGKILDLACGLNPFSYKFLGCKPEYLANDISPELCDIIQDFFDINKIKGQSFVFDLLDFKKSEFSKFIKSDVCFLFKTLDSLETIEWDFSEKLIKYLPCKYIVVSFAKHSLGGKKEIKERTWFQNVLVKNKMKFEFFDIENESFYVIKKKKK